MHTAVCCCCCSTQIFFHLQPMGGNSTFTCVVGWKATVPHFGRCCTLARHNYHAQRRHNVAHGQSGATTAMCGAGRVEPRSTKNMPYSKIHRSPHHITPHRGQLHRAQMLSPAVRVCRVMRTLSAVRVLSAVWCRPQCVCYLLQSAADAAAVFSPKKKVRPVV